MTIKEAQAKCRHLRNKGDNLSLALAEKLEDQFKNNPDYESDNAWLLRVQSGER